MLVIRFTDTGVPRPGGAEALEAWFAEGRRGLIWVDLDVEPVARQREILQQFDLHPLAIEDALRTRHPPKLEVFNDVSFLLLRGLDADKLGLNFGVIQLALFAGADFLVTRHSGRSMSVEAIREDLLSGSAAPPDAPLALALRLARRLCKRYVDLIVSLEDRLDEIEREMFEHLDDALLSELTRYKSSLRQLQRIAGYHTRLSERLADTSTGILPANLVHEGVDLFEENERAASLAELHYNIAKDLSDSYLGLSSHRLNRVMQILTIITVIFVPLTFIAGIYGMNFENIPELRSPFGYFIVIGVMLIIAVVQLALFRKKKWM